MDAKKLSTSLVFGLVLAATVGFGALVNYLSNTVTYSVSIESPIALGSISGSGTVHGGDTQTYSYDVTNNANNAIEGIHQFVITEPEGAVASCDDDLTAVSFTYQEGEEEPTSFEVTCTADGNVLTLTTAGVTHGAGATGTATWEITFNPAIQPGDYAFSITVVPA